MALDATYRAFVAAQPGATIWHAPAMLEAVTSADERLSVDYVALEQAGRTVCVLPFCRKARPDGWVVTVPPLLRYCGPLFDGEWLRGVGYTFALELLGQVLPAGYRSLDQSWSPALPLGHVRAMTWPSGVVTRTTHLLDLRPGIDAIHAARAKQVRYDLRRARRLFDVKFHAQVSPGDHDLLEAPYRRQGMAAPYDRAVVDRLAAVYGPAGQLACARISDAEGRPRAAAVYLADQTSGYAYLTGADEASRKYGLSNFAVSLGPEWAAGKGLTEFDFLGSDHPGIADTLRRLGGVPTSYGHVYRDTVPWTKALRMWRGG